MQHTAFIAVLICTFSHAVAVTLNMRGTANKTTKYCPASEPRMVLAFADPGPMLPPGMIRYPGLALNPPVKLQSFKTHHQKTTGMPAPADYWFLDAPTILKVIQQSGRSHTSKWAINLGAKPQPQNNVAHNASGAVIDAGDDVTTLYHMGYSGMNFDLSLNKAAVDQFYKRLGPKQHVAYDIFPDTVVQALQSNGVPKEPDFLKVDVDSFECGFINSILTNGYRPLVISSEVNAVAVPPLQYQMLYSRDGINFNDMVGNTLGSCSLQTAHNIISAHGYTLIQFTLEDGWWVRNEFAARFGNIPHDPATAYRIGNPYFYGRFPTKMKKWMSGDPKVASREFKDLMQCTVQSQGIAKGFLGKRVARYHIG